MKQTDSVTLGPTRVITDFREPGVSSVRATVKSELGNLEESSVDGVMTAVVKDDEGKTVATMSQKFTMGPAAKKTLALPVTIENPNV